MSWLGNGFREQAQALSDAYASMYAPKEETTEEVIEEGKKSPEDKLKLLSRLMQQAKDPHADTTIKKEEEEILASLSDAYNMMYEKKKDSDKCGEGTYWDKEEKKCKKKKSSSKTTVVVGRGGIYGPGYHGGGGGTGGDNGGDGETDGGDGGDGGGDGGGGGE